jgi:hypothetical protein
MSSPAPASAAPPLVMAGSGPVSVAITNAGLSNPWASAAFSALPPPGVPESHTFAGCWTVNIPQAVPADGLTFYQALHTVPGVADLVSRFTIVNVEQVRVFILPINGTNIDLSLRLVALEWAELPIPATRTPAVIARMPLTAHFPWRSNITVPQGGYVALPWPSSDGLATSLRAPGPGLYRPAMVLTARASTGAQQFVQGDISIMVSMDVQASGRGLLGYPA